MILRLRTNLNQKNVHAVDMVTIGTKEDPLPMKDVDDERILSLSDGKYCGHNSIAQALRDDQFEVMIGDKLRTTSRWAMNIVNHDLRNPTIAQETDQMAQFARVHCGATISPGDKPHELKTGPCQGACH